MSIPETGPITNRIKSPKTVTPKKNTVITLSYRRSERKQNAGSSVIEVFFNLKNGAANLTLETDTVLGWRQLPQIAANRPSWERVRNLVANCFKTPDDAYLEVAFDHIAKRWKFDLDYVDDEDRTAHLNIIRSKFEHENLVAATNFKQFVPFFDIDFKTIDRESWAKLDN